MMKNDWKMWMLIILLSGAVSCKKDNGQLPIDTVYEENILGIKKEEPVLLTFSSSGNTTKVQWTVTPSLGVSKSEVGNYATLLFSIAGKYSVLAKAESATAKYNVEVIEETYKSYGDSFNLEAAKLVNINAGEPVLFSLHNGKPGVKISWSASNANSSYTITENAANNTAIITFNKGGYGSVTASDGIHTERRTVWVNDNVNNNPNEDTVSFILGDKLLLQPSIQVVGANKQLVISTITTNSYHCATDKILSFSEGSSYMIDYAGVAIAPQPCSDNNKPSCTNRFTNIPVGNHPFVINYENKTFVGNINVSSTGIYTFIWPNNSSINIFPLVVQ